MINLAKNVDFNIISTGSKGNAVIINSGIMIDCGVPFKALKNHYRLLKLVLLTHIHSDHFNRATIKKLAFERPSLRFGVPEWLVGDVVGCGVSKGNIDVYGMDSTQRYEGFCAVHTYPLVHDVPNCAYSIGLCGCYVFYATDTNNLDGIEAKNYDLYLVEANYTEPDILERIKTKQTSGEYVYEWDVLKNHLSKEKAAEWIYRNAGQNSMYVYLHGHESKE